MTETHLPRADCLWLHYGRPRPHWYRVPADEQARLASGWAAVKTDAKAAGAVHTGRFHIRGQHDFETVDVWRFPGSQAAFDFWQALVAARYAEFFAFSNNIGLELEEETS